MTTVDVVLDVAAARKRTDEIRETGMRLCDLVAEAYECQDWAALGYDSWDDYCAQEFGTLDQLPRGERQEVVVSLRGKGLSLRAIGAATGVTEGTVRNDLSGAQKAAENYAPDADDEPDDEEPLPIKGLDGKKYPKPQPKPKPKPTPPPKQMLTLLTHEGEKVLYPKPQSKATFNQSPGPGISWASWSWNPVTGCLHGCTYCYAREIATSARNAETYPAGFTPLFHSERLEAPANTTIPAKHADDPAYRRVFVCSMADLYGRWVPQEWIDQVHAAMLDNPQWQYITLTKFPDRYPGLKLPDRAWIGTSVDEQKRVRIAERAFTQLPDNVTKWLSLEPLREPLEFDDLSMFDWIVIGAQTATRQPDGVVPAFKPEFRWVARIIAQADEAGCRIHCKPNLQKDPGMEYPDEYPDD